MTEKCKKTDWNVALEPYRSTKFILVFLCLTAVFGLVAIGRDVEQLAIIVPAILAFYIGGNVWQDVAKTNIQAKYDVPSSESTIETSAGSGP